MKSVVASPTRIDGQQVAALCGINVRQVRHSFGRSGRVWLSHSPFHELISIVSSTYNEPRLMTPAPAATPEDDGEVASNEVKRDQLHLTSLPLELLIYLLDFLEWPSIAALRLASQHFSNALPRQNLMKYHKLLSTVAFDDEVALLKGIEKEYWEQAEESFLGYHSSSYTSSSLDPDLRAHSERYSCTTSSLPCYHCLRWLPSITESPGFEVESMFSRGMCTGSRNLAGKQARSRICIPCGLRTGLYCKGGRVKKSVICFRCGMLAEPKDKGSWFWRDPKETWKLGVYCRMCLELPSVICENREQYYHEKRWRKHELTMAAREQNRLERGRRIREEKQILDEHEIILVTTNGFFDLQKLTGKRHCPIMNELRLCGCRTLAQHNFFPTYDQPYAGTRKTWPFTESRSQHWKGRRRKTGETTL